MPPVMQRRDLLRTGLYALAAPLLGAVPAAAGSDRPIVSCAIHPAIGIARVGNSPDQWFLGPETPGPLRPPEGGAKDASGRLKRQGARFRIYGLDAAGRVVRELTADEAEITWTVELANTKAAWYAFQMALDIPEAAGSTSKATRRAPVRTPRRNAHLQGAARARLAIRPGPRSITVGPGDRTARAEFDSGTFLGQRVPLGAMRADASGRLLVVGGFGHSAAIPATHGAPDYRNNDFWHDDVSDGPVDAVVRLNGRTLPVTGAWVVVAPPAFAPGITPVVTLYDLIAAASASPADRTPSFARDIYPIFERLALHQWVNAGFAREFGHGAADDFLAPATIAQLADPSAESGLARRQLFRRFRDPAYRAIEAQALPPYYGDTEDEPPPGPRGFMALLPHQHRALARWAAGDFVADLPREGVRFARSLDEIPVPEQPAALDRAQLDAASGGPFHPGCEVAWIVRRPQLYAAPFRFKRRAGRERDYGPVMTAAIALRRDGPLAGLAAGDITRWMAVPWQVDAANCSSGYTPEVDPYLPAFWPALVPNDVLAEAQYRALMAAGDAEARATALAFARRVKWLRGFASDMAARNTEMIARWHRLGIVAERPGPAAGPARVWVESGRDLPEEP